MHFIKSAILFVLRLALVIGAFLLLVGGPFYFLARWLAPIEPIISFMLIGPWCWFVHRFLLSPLEYRLDFKSRQYDPWYENRVESRQPDEDDAPRHAKNRHDSVFFHSARSRRQPAYLLFSLGMGGVGLAVLILGSAELFRHPVPFSGKVLFNVILSFIWCAGMLGIGGVMLRQFLQRQEFLHTIDHRGITSHDRHWPWRDVRWIALRPAESGSASVYFVFGTRRWLAPDRYLPDDRPVPRQQASEALSEIAAYLAKNFPEVHVG